MTPSRWSQRTWLAFRAAAAAVVLGSLLWPSGAGASELALERGGVPFSALDGGAADGDGVADGVLTLDRLSLAGNAEILIDTPRARFAVAGDVLLLGTSAIRGDGAAAPRVEIEASGSIVIAGDAAVRADAAAGGSLRLCAGDDLEIGSRATISASATTAGGAGGSIHLEAGDRLAVGPAATLRAEGASGGRVALVSCGAGTTGPGRSIAGAAVAVEGRIEATGSGTGGRVEIEARQGAVGFGPGPALLDASGATGGGAVSVTAAFEVSPAVPPAQPEAVVRTDSPSVRPCDCSGGDDDPVGVGELLVAAEVDRPTGLAGTLFTFSGRVVQTNAPVNDWQWTLSDGRVLSGQSISVSFPSPGLYGAVLVATDDDGDSFESETGVVVFDPATQAPPEFGLPPRVGDVDGDGAITLRDAHRVGKHAGGLESLAASAVPAGDIDLDGEVTPADALLLGQAVAANATLPTVLLPAHGAPGTRVNLISPELLDPTALVEVEVGESQWVQTPLRAARGYATFVIPFDATVRDSFAVVPGPVEVRVLRDGVVVDRLAFEVEAPPPLPADPKAELISFLDDYVELFALSREAVLRLADLAGVDGEERELLIATYTAAEQDTAAKVARLEALLAEPGGEEVAELFFRFANANGYGALRQQMDELLAPDGAASALRVAAAASSAQIDEILAIVCAVRDASELLSTGSDLLSTGCDALLVLAVAAAAFPGEGPAGEAAALATWATACGAIEATVELALLINELVGSIEPDLRFEGSPTSPGAGESVELRAEIELAGLDDICAFTVGKARSEMIEELAEKAVERLLRKKLALRAISRAVRFFSDDVFEELEDRLEELVVRAIDHTAIGNLLEELTAKVCDVFQAGVPLLDDLSVIMEGPDPNVGTLTFNGDGTASYTCPDDTSQSADSVTFTARREICGDQAEQTVTVTCQSRPVTITIGDNGSANDDIYEVRIEGETVLTSSVPVRSISTTVQLAVGDHVVEMIGRAAPDGIGTYFISFSGATVIGGDALSGTDLTPGVVKTFVIRVQ